MNPRHNFYSSVFETINSYKKKDGHEADRSGLFGDSIVEMGLFASGFLFAVVSGFAFVYPQFMQFRTVANTQIATQQNVFTPENTSAKENALPIEIRLVPSADAYVDAAHPDKNYGTDKRLLINGSPQQSVFLLYRLPKLPRLSEATLHIPGTDTRGWVDLYLLPQTTFDESDITANTQPIDGAVVIGTISDTSNAASIDVLSYVTGRSTLAIMLKAKSGSVFFNSKESGSSELPLLILR